MATAILLQADLTTQGSWVGVYGSEGYNICGYGTPSYPSYVKVTAINNNPYTNTASTASVKGLQKYDNSSDRFIGGWYGPNNAGQPLTLDLQFTGDHQLALYLNDFDNGSRSQTVVIADGDTGATLDSRNLGLPVGFWNPPLWLIYRVNGHVKVVVTTLNAATTLINGFFFDPAPATGYVSSLDGITGPVTLSGTDIVVADNTPTTGNIQFSQAALSPSPIASNVLDHFIDANGVDLVAHTMDAGPGWTRVDSGSVIQVQGNVAKTITLDGASSRAGYVTQRGLTDCTTNATVTIAGAGEAGLIWRYIDATHFWAVSGYSGDGKYYVYLANGAAPQPIASYAAGVQANVPFVMQVVTAGNVHKLFKDNSLVATFTDATNNSGTRYGIRSWQVNNTWDEFNCSPTPFTNATVTLDTKGRVTAVSSGAGVTATPDKGPWYPIGGPQVIDMQATNPAFNSQVGGFATGGYAYIYGYNNFLVRLNPDLSAVSALDLTTATSSYAGAVGGFTDGRYGYLANAGSGYIIRVDLNAWSSSGVTVLDMSGLDPSVSPFWGMNYLATDGQYGYTPSSGNTSVLGRFSLSNFTTAGASYLDLTPVLGGSNSYIGEGVGCDGTTVYATWTNQIYPGPTYQTWLTATSVNDFSAAGSRAYQLPDNTYTAVQIAGGYVYPIPFRDSWGLGQEGSKILKIKKDFSQTTTLDLATINSNYKGFAGAFIDARGRFLYLGASMYPYSVRVDLADFATVQAIDMQQFWGQGVVPSGFYSGAFSDGRYGYVSRAGDSTSGLRAGKVARFQLFRGNT